MLQLILKIFLKKKRIINNLLKNKKQLSMIMKRKMKMINPINQADYIPLMKMETMMMK